MGGDRARFGKIGAGLLATVLLAYGCAAQPEPKKKTDLPTQFDDEGGGDYGDPLINPDKTDTKSGTFGAQERRSNGSASTDAGRPDGSTTVGGKTYCSGDLARGDLVVVEIMIAGAGGKGDAGEWVELQSTRNCWLSVNNLVVTTQSAAQATSAPVVTSSIDIRPYGTIVIADTQDAEQNRNLFGTVFAWDTVDALRDTGDTIVVKRGNVEVDRVTYPSFANLKPGRSLSFPADCPWNTRSDWSRWSLAFSQWTSGLSGTPNTPNDDVSCY